MNTHNNSPIDTNKTLPGLLTDKEISRQVDSGLLIEDEFEYEQLQCCCYELRVGNISYTYDYENKQTKQQKNRTHTIYPFETLTIITMEKVNLDDKHFLLLFSKGSLFSMGLTPVCTAADPGFRGHLGITMTNLSARPVQFDVGQSLVKGVFFHLNEAVDKSYMGQHGDATMSWPYPSQFHTEPIDFTSSEASCWRFLPLPVRQTISQLSQVQKHIKYIVFLFLSLLTLNIISFILPTLVGFDRTSLISFVNILGSFFSILGFLISLSFYRAK